MVSSLQFIPMIESSSSSSSSSLSNESSSDGDDNTISQCYKKRMQRTMLSPQILDAFSHFVKRRYINRDRERTNQQMWRDYFTENCTYSPDYFHRRYRMRRELFLQILNDVEACEEYFVQNNDACGRLVCSSIPKLTAAIYILAYRLSADHCEEYLKIGESTAIQSLKLFCKTIISLYEEQYLLSPNEQDIARLLQEGAVIGFPSMLGSLDCMHWEWKNCPTAWHDTHRGHHHKPTLILEAVGSKDLWIWHTVFGMAGSHNDLNALHHSSIFDNLIYDQMPPVNYKVNGHQYTLGHYLTDGIYPKWATLMQTIAHPTTEK